MNKRTIDYFNSEFWVCIDGTPYRLATADEVAHDGYCVRCGVRVDDMRCPQCFENWGVSDD